MNKKELAKEFGFEVKSTLNGGLDFISNSKLIRMTFDKDSNLFQAYTGKLSTFSNLEELEKELELRSKEYQNALEFCKVLRGRSKMNKARIKVEKSIDDCRDCPFCERDEYYYDRVRGHSWDCKKAKKPIIDDLGYEELGGSKIPIPDWCPFREEGGNGGRRTG